MIKNPYDKPYVIGAHLGSLQNGGNGNTSAMIDSLSSMAGVKVVIKGGTDVRCFPNGLPPTHENPQYLPCSQAGDILQNSSFCLVIVNNWEALTSSAVRSIHAQLWACFFYRSIPVIPTKYEPAQVEKYLPFFSLLESLWSKAIVYLPFTSAQNFVSKLNEISKQERIMRLDKISKLFNRHLETVGKQVETAVATLNKALLLPQPAVPTVRTRLVAEIPRTQVRVYTLDEGYNESKSIVGSNLAQTEPLCNTSMRVDFEGPLWTFDKTPWTMCHKSSSSTILTAFLFWRYAYSNDTYFFIPPKPETYQWPKTPFPIHVIRVPLNKLQSRFLPFDLIKTDAVLTVDDEVVPDLSAMKLGFGVWNDNPDRIVGYVARSHEWLKSHSNFKYIASATSPYSLILTGASFLHKYFLYAYTFELPHEVYTSVDALMNCEDIAMNMLSQQISEKAPYQVSTVTRFACPLCKGGLSRKKSHYLIRSACITNFIHFFGYDPLKYSTFTRKGR
ncbi:unnamed protein product [Hydatigera taeniaeformis]|uniref:Glyco_transf_64 domain-containing protein n=1 Tax=Hydatigena taeniaeformis TaxID=6205 RepID=A0A158RDE1_HYDTA|nr:unnamed protein product [Hydatigera taeniaeformis]